MNTEVTQADIAKALKIARSTVTMALKNDQSIAEETRQLVHSKAKELGYVPNPSLSALAAYRHKKGSPVPHSSIAIIRNEVSIDKKFRSRNRIYESLVERAKVLGYSATAFRSDFSAKSLKSILRQCHARGIRGVILFSYLPLNSDEISKVDWSEYAVLSLVASTQNDRIPNIDFGVYNDTIDVVRRIAEAGYQRPGIIVNRATADVNFDLSLNAFREACKRFGLDTDVPPYRHNTDRDVKEIWAWAKQEKIDLALGVQLEFVGEILNKIVANEPLSFDFVCMDLNTEHIGKIAGAYGQRSEIANAAINQVHGMIQTWRFGLPQHSYSILVRKLWQNGVSAPRIQ